MLFFKYFLFFVTIINMISKFIDFIITQNCTYKCAYCSQSKNETTDKQSADKKTINSFLNFLTKIDNDFEITLTGGEAILHPDFYYLIKEIKNLNFKINLISNLSFPIEVYQGIFNILDDNLNKFDISCHLDEIKNFNHFLDKLDDFIKLKPPSTKVKLLIPIYNIDNDKKEKIKQLEIFSKNTGIDFEYQKIRFLTTYLKDDSEFQFNIPPVSYAKYCYSGCYSCVIYPDGRAYRCYSSRFIKSNYLGNVNDYNFKLNKDKKICTQKCCTCPKPVQNEQLTNETNYFLANLTTLSNLLYLPILMIKNRKIVLEKFNQYFNLKN